MNPFAFNPIGRIAADMQPPEQPSGPAFGLQGYDLASDAARIKDALAGRERKMRDAYSVAMQMAQMAPVLPEMRRVGGREAAIAGGIAALGGLLGARNAAPALGTFLQGRGQMLQEQAQTEYQRRLAEAQRQARILEAQRAQEMGMAQSYGQEAESLMGLAQLGQKDAQALRESELDIYKFERTQAQKEKESTDRLRFDYEELAERYKPQVNRDFEGLTGMGIPQAEAFRIAMLPYAKTEADINYTLERTRLLPEEMRLRVQELAEDRRARLVQEQQGFMRLDLQEQGMNQDFALDMARIEGGRESDVQREMDAQSKAIMDSQQAFARSLIKDDTARVNADIKRLEGIRESSPGQAAEIDRILAAHRVRLRRNSSSLAAAEAGEIPGWIVDQGRRLGLGAFIPAQSTIRSAGEVQPIPRRREPFPAIPRADADGAYSPLSPLIRR